jgi:hypothetical protein
MTDPALSLLEMLRETYGGSIYQLRPATAVWAAAWTWSLQGSGTVPMLTALLPHLLLKKRQAILALEVESIRAALPRRPNGGGSWTPEARVACEAIKTELHRLNRKGARVQIAGAA